MIQADPLENEAYQLIDNALPYFDLSDAIAQPHYSSLDDRATKPQAPEHATSHLHDFTHGVSIKKSHSSTLPVVKSIAPYDENAILSMIDTENPKSLARVKKTSVNSKLNHRSFAILSTLKTSQKKYEVLHHRNK